MPSDASPNAVLQALTTVTATTNSTAVDFLTTPSTPRRGYPFRWQIPSLINGTAGTVFTPSIQDSADNTTFNTITQGLPITGTTTAQATEFWMYAPGNARRYLRAVMTMSTAGGAPTVAYSVAMTAANP